MNMLYDNKQDRYNLKGKDIINDAVAFHMTTIVLQKGANIVTLLRSISFMV
jgi:hypothetical protein